MFDMDAVRQKHPIVDAAIRYGVNLTRCGDEFEACCPFHQEDTPSFTIYRGRDGVGRFYCFGCGKRGDVIDLTAEIKGVSSGQALKILEGGVERKNVAPVRLAKPRDAYAGYEPLPKPGALKTGDTVDLFNPKSERTWRVKPAMVFPYSNGGYVLRNNLSDGSKETPMVMWCRRPDGSEGWTRFPFPKPRPLYRIDRVNPAGQVIIVEGEKCADKLAALMPQRNVISWPGGTNGVDHCDWSPVIGRKVVIWPDADEPGVKTARRIAEKFSSEVKIAGVEWE